MSENQTKPRVAIIGSGPSGLTAGIYTSRAMLETTIFMGSQPGGQLTTTSEIENFPGAWDTTSNHGILGPVLMQTIQKQAEYFGAKTVYDNVNKLEVEKNDGKNIFKITTESGVLEFDSVIIASGSSAKYLELEGEEKYVGKGYHSCATCDGFFYRGKTVAIVGGGDSGMEEANFLTKFATKVYLIHRREEFKASKIMLQKAQENPKIEFLLNKVVSKMHGEDNLEKLTLKDTITGVESDLDIDGLFVAIGHTPNSNFVGNLLDKDEAGYLTPNFRLPQDLRTNKYMMGTKIEGLFVAGDIEDSYYRQAITAAGDGCRAAIECERWLSEKE